MATEQIKYNQITATGTPSNTTYLRGDGSWSTPSSSGQQVSTQTIAVSGGTGDKTTSAFGFVVGMVFIELLETDNANANDVTAAGWVNMRSFSGTKTADVTDRWCWIGYATGGPIRLLVDRTTSGTVINIGRPQAYGASNVDGTGLGALTNYNWDNPGRIRITAWEDMQA